MKQNGLTDYLVDLRNYAKNTNLLPDSHNDVFPWLPM